MDQFNHSPPSNSTPPQNLDKDIFIFRNNRLDNFDDDDESQSHDDSSNRGSFIKDTIWDKEFTSEDESDDDDYLPQLSTDPSDDEEQYEEEEDNKRNNHFIYNDNYDGYKDSNNTQHHFKPISKHRQKVELSFKFIPFIILLFVTLLLCYKSIYFIVDTFHNNNSHVASSYSSSNSFINHQIMILNDQVNQLISAKAEIEELKMQLNSVLNLNLNSNLNSIPTSSIVKSSHIIQNVSDQSTTSALNLDSNTITVSSTVNSPDMIQIILDKLVTLENKIDSVLNSNPSSTVNNSEMIQIILDKLATLEDRMTFPHTKAKTIDYSTSISQNKRPQEPKPQFNSPKPVSHNKTFYSNIAKQFEVDTSLTTFDKRIRPKPKLNTFERGYYGFWGFMRRFKFKIMRWGEPLSWWEVVSGDILEPFIDLNDPNGPLNVLSEKSNKQWVRSVDDLPIYFTLKIDKGIRLREIGIHQNKQLFNLKSNVRLMSLFVQPLGNINTMKSFLKLHVNQDIDYSKFHKDLKNWVRLSQCEFDVYSHRNYQQFQFDPKWIQNWDIQKVMIIIHSNWGDDQNVILDTIRIFEENPSIQGNSIQFQQHEISDQDAADSEPEKALHFF